MLHDRRVGPNVEPDYPLPVMSVVPGPVRDHLMDHPKTDAAPTRAGVPNNANVSLVKNNNGPGAHHQIEDLIDALRNWGSALPTAVTSCLPLATDPTGVELVHGPGEAMAKWAEGGGRFGA